MANHGLVKQTSKPTLSILFRIYKSSHLQKHFFFVSCLLSCANDNLEHFEKIDDT